MVVRAAIRIKRLRFTPEPLSVGVARVDPYRIKILRKVNKFCNCDSYCNHWDSITALIFHLFKVIDGCAFRVYGHWVKKGEGQNRAALFENTPKTELKHMYVSHLSR